VRRKLAEGSGRMWAAELSVGGVGDYFGEVFASAKTFWVVLPNGEMGKVAQSVTNAD